MSKPQAFRGAELAKIALEALPATGRFRRSPRSTRFIRSWHMEAPGDVRWLLGEVFSNGGERRRRDHESEIRDLHAKIGELPVERDQPRCPTMSGR